MMRYLFFGLVLVLLGGFVFIYYFNSDRIATLQGENFTLNSVVSSQSSSVLDQVQRARYLARIGEFNTAIAILTSLPAKDKSTQANLQEIATIYYNQKNFQQALSYFQQALGQNLNEVVNQDIMIKILDINLHLGQLNSVKRFWQDHNIKTAAFAYRYLLALLGNVELKQAEQFVKEYRVKNVTGMYGKKILAIKKNFASYRELRDVDLYFLTSLVAETVRVQKYYYVSQQLVTSSLNLKPDYQDNYLILAYDQYAQGLNRAAITTLIQVQKLAPDNAKVYFLLALNYAVLGDVKQEIVNLNLALGSGYEYKDAILVALGKAFLIENRVDQAQIMALKITQNTASLPNLIWAFDLLLSLDDSTGAQVVLDAINSQYEGAVAVNALNAKFLLFQGETTTAKAMLLRKIGTKNFYVYFVLGLVYQAQDNKKDAKSMFKRAFVVAQNAEEQVLAADKLRNF